MSPSGDRVCARVFCTQEPEHIPGDSVNTVAGLSGQAVTRLQLSATERSVAAVIL